MLLYFDDLCNNVAQTVVVFFFLPPKTHFRLEYMNSHTWRPCTKYSYRAELQFLPIPQMLQWRFIPPPTWICWVRQQLFSLTPHATTVRKFRTRPGTPSRRDAASLACLYGCGYYNHIWKLNFEHAVSEQVSTNSFPQISGSQLSLEDSSISHPPNQGQGVSTLVLSIKD